MAVRKRRLRLPAFLLSLLWLAAGVADAAALAACPHHPASHTAVHGGTGGSSFENPVDDVDGPREVAAHATPSGHAHGASAEMRDHASDASMPDADASNVVLTVVGTTVAPPDAEQGCTCGMLCCVDASNETSPGLLDERSVPDTHATGEDGRFSNIDVGVRPILVPFFLPPSIAPPTA